MDQTTRVFVFNQKQWPKVVAAQQARAGWTSHTKTRTRTVGVGVRGQVVRLLPQQQLRLSPPILTTISLPVDSPSAWPWAIPVSSLLMLCKNK